MMYRSLARFLMVAGTAFAAAWAGAHVPAARGGVQDPAMHTLKLRDSEGRVRVIVGELEDGEFGIGMLDEHGERRASLRVSKSGSTLTINGGDGANHVTLGDDAVGGRARLYITSGDAGHPRLPIHIESLPELARIAIGSDTSFDDSLNLQVEYAKRQSIVIHESGRPRIGLYAQDNSAGMLVWDENRAPLMSLQHKPGDPQARLEGCEVKGQ
ncbi:MAG: hypothetical protein IPM29_32835 [Planctomycetes bacterium]|nr:hypothetical protein [Planctomycetota bacterium]